MPTWFKTPPIIQHIFTFKCPGSNKTLPADTVVSVLMSRPMVLKISTDTFPVADALDHTP
ncbi:hypothetical protein BT96DRAFT_924651 [Gymnopus androsaceus JB14]|uniref:Uncharacterized protein n=1 Tax=Gymnopus androsaceus JB14 TaxID=1447944 RepID=A0A6A4H5V6_9AGAR|nr:hypothetical protein BT96DRAFT_924651 [Gymnopus androsaceus JB14]